MQRSILIWLFVVFCAIGLMVVVGGITRLTGSGLSMVTWRPLMGVLPPLSDAAWQLVFEKYRTSPQFQEVNHWMTLADFKMIFFWEYLHRLFGRVIGLVFIGPWFWFIAKGALRGRLAIRTFIAFLLGGLQGVLGWYMVKSGLVDIPSVSHYRLAAHLSLAFFVGMYVLWIFLDIRQPGDSSGNPKIQRGLWVFLAVLSLQIIYGAFMAGTRAGHLYQTFPDMNGELIPSGFWRMQPLFINFIANHDAIHFLHRLLGWLVFILGILMSVIGHQKAKTPTQKTASISLGSIVAAQFLFGVFTVVFAVPIVLAAAHQAGAFILLSVTVWMIHCHRDVRKEIFA